MISEWPYPTLPTYTYGWLRGVDTRSPRNCYGLSDPGGPHCEARVLRHALDAKVSQGKKERKREGESIDEHIRVAYQNQGI